MGGESGGFAISSNRVFMLPKVENAERAPIISGKMTEKIYTFVLYFILITRTIITRNLQKYSSDIGYVAAFVLGRCDAALPFEGVGKIVRA